MLTVKAFGSMDQSFGGANLVTPSSPTLSKKALPGDTRPATVDWAKGQQSFNELKIRFVRIGEKLPNRKVSGYCVFCGARFNEVARVVYHVRRKHFSPDIMEFGCPHKAGFIFEHFSVGGF